jgi:uncharacterized protein YaaQ
MFSKIWNYLVNVEQTVVHDVEALIADFTSTITKLEAAAEAKAKEAHALTQISIAVEQQADVAFAASEKATKVAGQIKALVS